MAPAYFFIVDHKEVLMTLEEILSLDSGDIARLSKSDIRQASAILRKEVTSRLGKLSRYEKRSGHTPPSLIQYRNNPIRLGKQSLNSYRAYFSNLKKFIGYKTSTVEGAEEHRLEMRERFGDLADDPNFFRALNRFQDKYRKALAGVPSNIVVQMHISQRGRPLRTLRAIKEWKEGQYTPEPFWESDDIDEYEYF